MFTIRKPFIDRVSVTSNTVGVSLTKQSEAESCDVNKIIKQYKRSGVLPTPIQIDPRYGDASVPDYQSCLNIVIAAEGSFYSLPSAIRSRFDNNIAKFMDFVHDPANTEEGIKLGIFQAPEKPLNQPSADLGSLQGGQGEAATVTP